MTTTLNLAQRAFSLASEALQWRRRSTAPEHWPRWVSAAAAAPSSSSWSSASARQWRQWRFLSRARWTNRTAQVDRALFGTGVVHAESPSTLVQLQLSPSSKYKQHGPRHGVGALLRDKKQKQNHNNAV